MAQHQFDIRELNRACIGLTTGGLLLLWITAEWPTSDGTPVTAVFHNAF